MTEVVADDVTGIHVPVDYPALLAGAPRMIGTHPLLRTRLGEAGREAVGMKFRQQIVIDRLSTLYEAFADRRLAGARERING